MPAPRQTYQPTNLPSRLPPVTIHELAGKPAPASLLIDVPCLVSSYYTQRPDPSDASQRVSFGTSGHRGSSFDVSFNEDHVWCVVQAVCDYRKTRGVDGPLFLGKDTHALSEPAHRSTLEVLAANRVEVMMDAESGYTPTPAVSHAILTYNQGRRSELADGIIITPSHNPPGDGGIKYNPPHGGPAESEITAWIEDRANRLLENRQGLKRWNYRQALSSPTTHRHPYRENYVSQLDQVVDLEAVRSAELRLAADALGGAGIRYWDAIAERYRLKLTLIDGRVDHTFAFVPVDHDGKIRMDCSSPHAMAGLVELKDRYDLAFGNDPDFDRHGIVTSSGGLMNPNHYLAVCIWYLFQHRPDWKGELGVGKTLVSTSMIDRIAADLGKEVVEMPVGFKWFVQGLLNRELGFCGEESAGACFLRRDGSPWTTDKDGFILNLLAAELTAVTGLDPDSHYEALCERFGRPHYARTDRPANSRQKELLAQVDPERLDLSELAGDPVEKVLTHAPGNGAPIGGLKVTCARGWFAARPSGTEEIYKIYAESFVSPEHLKEIQRQASAIVNGIFRS